MLGELGARQFDLLGTEPVEVQRRRIVDSGVDFAQRAHHLRNARIKLVPFP